MAAWAPHYLRGGGDNCAEKLHRSFLKRALGRLPQSTPNSVVLAETGRYPLAAHWGKLVARYWNRLVGLPDSRVTKWAFLEQMELFRARGWAGGVARQPWGAQVVGYLESLGQHPIVDGMPQAVNSAGVHKAACEAFVTGMRQEASTKPKVQFYCTAVRGGLTTRGFNKPPPYLQKVKNRAHLAHVARFRTGSHWLQVEVGRHRGVERSQRICPHCSMGVVEDEQHMVFHCPKYAHLRDAYGETLFAHPGTQTLRQFLDQDAVAVASFVHQCAQLVAEPDQQGVLSPEAADIVDN